MLELEPPKPTKEFHDAYLEIYGKGKKKTEDRKINSDPLFSLDMPKKNTKDDLSALDVPPLKLEPIPKMQTMPTFEIVTAPSLRSEPATYLLRTSSDPAGG